MKKIPKNLLIGLHNALNENFFVKGNYADRIIDKLLKDNKKWGSRDRKFVSESFYEIIRWKRHYEFFIDKEMSKENIYSIILSYLLKENIYDISNVDLFDEIDFQKIQERFDLEFPTKAIKYSIPNWMEKLFSENISYWENEISSMNEKAKTILRVNTLKSNLERLQKSLLEQGIEAQPIDNYPNALILEKRKKLTHLDLYKKGHFEIQDANSQEIVEFLDIKENNLVVDACAGAGGKTLQIGEKLNNTGDIIAFDINKKKLAELEKRAERNGIKNIMTKPIKKITEAKEFKEIADRLLIDAPCSGLGILKRNPDTKWKLTEDFLAKLKEQQKEILQEYSKILKIGGKMIYSTCSLLKEENEVQVEYFLKNNSNFKLISEKLYSPNKTNFDGFYLAVIEKI